MDNFPQIFAIQGTSPQMKNGHVLSVLLLSMDTAVYVYYYLEAGVAHLNRIDFGVFCRTG